MKPLALATALIFFFFAPALAAQRPDLNATMKKAVGAYQSGLYYEAEESFLQVDRAKPDVPDVVHGLAMCCFLTRRYEPAIEYFKRLTQMKKPQAQFFNNFASLYEETGEPDLAKPLFEKALEIDPKFTASHFALGRIAARKGEMDVARKDLLKAIELDSKHAEAHYELAGVEFAAGAYDEADRLARRAIALMPRHVGAHFLIARVALKKKNTDEGKRLLAEAQALQKDEDRRALDQKKIGSYLALAFEARRNGRIRESITYFGEIIKIDPRHAQTVNALNSMEKVLRDAGQTAEADLCKKALGGAQ